MSRSREPQQPWRLCSTTRPIQRGFFSGPSSTWRDARHYGNHVYVTTEGGGGVQIIDVSNPNSPTLVGTRSSNRFSRAHNIALDPGTGWIYA